MAQAENDVDMAKHEVDEADKKLADIKARRAKIFRQLPDEEDNKKIDKLLGQTKKANQKVIEATKKLEDTKQKLEQATKERDTMVEKFESAKKLLAQRKKDIEEQRKIKQKIDDLTRQAEEKEQNAKKLTDDIIRLLGGRGE